MVSVTHAAHEIEVTAESLQEDLARLEVQKQSLERELAAVKALLGSVQRALGALQTLRSAAGSAPPVAVGATGTHETGGATRGSATGAGHDGSRRRGHGLRRGGRSAEVRQLTEQILDYFAGAGDTDVRARDVAEALGRATDSGSINAVRSTLDRLVGTSRIRRAGRGLYRAA
ncbi:hypothetical protein [Streptomyces sp. NPDC005476]|uniref:hypothetical protein n=1 Tax=Streptomyces sp. NPDC005476 TaxID=3156882 RepID=UPI003451A964